jgi:tetratricopeptide (TPR) repeat protein
MGLFADSLSIYENVLPAVSPEDGQTHALLKKRISILKKEIADQEEKPLEVGEEEDIEPIIDAFADSQDASAIFDIASAFKEMGLHNKAVAEYVRLFEKDYPVSKIVPELTESLLKQHSPSRVIKELDRLIEEKRLAEDHIIGIKFHLGQELEKRDLRELALDCYKAAHQLDPADVEIKKRLDSVAATFTSGSRYDYLLREKMVTTDQLQKAFALSRRMNKSVEYVLIEHFRLSKEAIGKSFSLFYDCPFKDFDPQHPVPFELLSKLKKSFLLNELWVPLSWSKDSMEILVDDPRDLNKTDNIKALLKTNKIQFSVAMREDIAQFINRFFDPDQHGTGGEEGESLDDFEFPDVAFEEEEEEVEVDEADEASGKVVKLVDQIIIAAYRKNASDIHIEPSPITKATGIRFRLDGVCQEYMKVPNTMVRGIISRIKIMSNLDIAERRLPQDGKNFGAKGCRRLNCGWPPCPPPEASRMWFCEFWPRPGP